MNTLSLAEFTESFTEQVLGTLGEDYNSNRTEIIKNNGVVLQGVAFRRSDSMIAPVFYPTLLYNDYCKGQSVESLVNVTVELIKSDVPEVDKFPLGLEDVKSRIFLKVVNKEMNQKVLESTLHIEFLDLAITFNLLVSKDEDGVASTRVTNAMAEQWGLGLDELYSIALENTRQLFQYRCNNMRDVLAQVVGSQVEMEESPMLVCTNEQSVFGASVILYDDFVKQFKNQKIIVLPSSIHEVIVIPYTEKLLEEVRGWVAQVNRAVVDTTEQLSNNVYVYDGFLNSWEVL